MSRRTSQGIRALMSRGDGAQEGRPCQFTLDTEQSRNELRVWYALHQGDQENQNVQRGFQ